MTDPHTDLFTFCSRLIHTMQGLDRGDAAMEIYQAILIHFGDDASYVLNDLGNARNFYGDDLNKMDSI